jgi:hypothetical protein
MSSGYTGKIVNTQMGPFAWNEATNSWVNQNNGFSIPNISLQDLMMYDFGTVTDETEDSTYKSTPCVNIITISPTSDSIARLAGVQVLLTNATLSTLTCPTNVFLKQTSISPNNVSNLQVYYNRNSEGNVKWDFNGTPGVNNTTGNILVNSGNFKLYVTRALSYIPCTVNFSLNNATTNEELSTYQVTIE